MVEELTAMDNQTPIPTLHVKATKIALANCVVSMEYASSASSTAIVMQARSVAETHV